MKNKQPAIRFKGFTEDWEQHKAKELCSISTGKSNTQDQTENGKYPFYIRSDKPVRSNKYLYDCEAVLTIGDGNIGKVFHYVNGKFDLHQRVYKMDNFKGIFGKYFYYFFSTKFYKRAMQMTAKATVDSVRLEMISEMDILMPNSIKEQIKISQILTEIDNLINLYQRKCDKLVNIKKSLLEKMFPKSDSNVPEIRFKGFTEDWEQYKLNEVAKITMGQSPSGENYTNNPEDYILVQGNADMKNGYVVPRVWTKQVTKIADIGDLIISVRAPVGEVGKTNCNIVIGRGVASIKGNEFVFQSLKKMKYNNYWKQFSAGSTFDAITSNELITATLSVTREVEQEKIGEFFKQIDNLINLYQRKVEKLQNIKKFCLDKMFV